MKISFLIAAHNEEKIIANALNNLIKLPYDNYEVILGLDGCDDRTEDIVKIFQKKSNKIKYYKLNLRQGKPAVIDEIIKQASGDIIIIHDADWIFKVNSRENLEKYLEVFKDSKIGGIAEAFPVEWNENIKKSNFGYKMTAYSAYFWLRFQKEKFVYEKDNILFVKEPSMFLTNVYRKVLYKKNFSLGDDFERTIDIAERGLKIVLFKDENMPRMIASYDKIGIKDLFKQKIRTAIARKQLKGKQKINTGNYYLPVIAYMIKNSFKYGGEAFLATFSWIILTTCATLIAKFKKADTKKNWTMRVER